MRTLLDYWNEQYYTQPLLLCVLFITLVISIRKRKKFPSLNYIPLYVISLLLPISGGPIFDLDLLSPNIKFYHYLDYFFTLIELWVFSVFYHRTLKSKFVKKLIIQVNVWFVPLYIYYLVTDRLFYHAISEETQSTVYTIEAFLIAVPCFNYFIELFKFPPTKSLRNDPAFWISTGILFFIVCTLPFSIIENHLAEIDLKATRRLYSLFFIFYVVLFCMIIRAYLCKLKEEI